MAELRDARSGSSGPSGDTMSADALYRQGMAHYRRRQWRQARDLFQGLKRLDPGWRGVDALLHELDIFINLEDLSPDETSMGQAATDRGPHTLKGAVAALQGALRGRVRRIVPAIFGAAALAFAAYAIVNVQVGQRIAELRRQGRSYRAAQQLPKAINAYEELLLLAPGDGEARDVLWAAYRERGEERSALAQSLELRHLYQEAAQQWEGALADLRAARDVDRGRHQDAQAELEGRMATAQEGRHGAALLAQAGELRAEERWLDVIQLLQALRDASPSYQSADVEDYLHEAYLQGGAQSMARAGTAAEAQEAVALLAQAADMRPDDAVARQALAQGRVYQQALSGWEGRQWGTAVEALQALLREAPGYAEGRAQELLCRSYMQRAGERHGAGHLREALADYEAMLALGCSQQAEAQDKAKAIALALTPTAAPTPRPTWTPEVTGTLALTLTLTPGPSPVPIPTDGTQ